MYIWGDLLVDIAVEGLTVKMCSGLIEARESLVRLRSDVLWKAS